MGGILKTKMVIVDDPLGTQGQATEDVLAHRAEIASKVQHPIAEVKPQPVDTEPVNPLATKVEIEVHRPTVQTAPGVEAVIGGQEAPGPTKVTIHAPTASDQLGITAMGQTNVQIIDDPLGRQRALEEHHKPQLAAAKPAKKATKKTAKKATKKTTKKRVAKKATKKRVAKKATKKRITKKRS